MVNIKETIKCLGLPVYLGLFQIAFIILMGLFASYKPDEDPKEVPRYYASNFFLKPHFFKKD
jgi:hypothetical protein